MTPDERNLLTQFLGDLTQYQNVTKDPEAWSMIQQALSRSPDAAYLLVQHAIVSDQALHAAQAHIVDLENQLAAAQPQYQPQGGFLGGGLGSLFGGGRQQPQYPQPQPMYTQAPQQGGFGSFLRTAGTMAAGVAAGDLLFSGVEGLFGGGRGGMFGGGGGETIINEYNDGGMGGGDFGGGGGDWDDGSNNF